MAVEPQTVQRSKDLPKRSVGWSTDHGRGPVSSHDWVIVLEDVIRSVLAPVVRVLLIWVYLLMALNVHNNLLRLIRDGGWGWGWGGGMVPMSHHLLATLSPPEWLCIKAGNCARHFNVLLAAWAKSQDNIHKPQILKRKESRSGSNRGLSAYQHSALKSTEAYQGWGSCGSGMLYLTPTRYTVTTRMILH